MKAARKAKAGTAKLKTMRVMFWVYWTEVWVHGPTRSDP